MPNRFTHERHSIGRNKSSDGRSYQSGFGGFSCHQAENHHSSGAGGEGLEETVGHKVDYHRMGRKD
jgi:hypothetical protein